LSIFLPLIGCGGPSLYQVDPIISYKRTCDQTWTIARGFPTSYPIELINPETYKPTGSDKSLYEIANDHTLQDAAQTARNKLQEKIMEVSNNEVAGHLSRVTGTQVTVNILLGGASTALSGAASLATGSDASLLSELSTGTGAFRSLFNEQVYRNALVETLVAAIASDRNKFLSDIRNLKQTLPIDEYCVQAAIHDMGRYHNKGSFYHGLTLIREAAEAENRKRLQESTPEAERKLRLEQLKDTLKIELEKLKIKKAKQLNKEEIDKMNISELLKD
jgi:hypothetical protein